FVAIDSNQLLRHTWQERGGQAPNLRPLTGCRNELIDVVRQELHVATRAVFENECEPTRRAYTGNSRGRETKSHGLGNCAERFVQPRFDLLELLGSCFSIAPLFHADEPKPAVAGADQAQQAEPRNRGDMVDARYLGSDFLYFRHDLFRALKRRGIGEL